MKNTVYLYVFDTMADWEIGYLSTEINSGRYYKKGLMPLKVVTDGSLITASGIAPLEFALHILKILDVFLPQTLDSWYNLYKTQESKYFFELMNSIQ